MNPIVVRLLLTAASLCSACLAQSAENAGAVVEIKVDSKHDRQVIDGFGGSLAYWGYNADSATLQIALTDMGATLIRVPAEVDQRGDPDAYRAVVQRAIAVAPDVGVYLTFWQPRSKEKPKPSDWVDSDASGKYRIKDSMREAWADEIVARAKTIRHDWHAKIVGLSVQNEPNFSVPGTLTCAWEPDAMATFIEHDLAPRVMAARLASAPISVPELAYVGDNASEMRRYTPVLNGSTTRIISYHMYDAYKDGTADAGFDELRNRQKALGQYLRKSYPSKRVWMSETTGALWNSAEWHTFGWNAKLDEYDKAIAAARYIHAALVDAEANAFLWWGLIYSAPPDSIKGVNEREKFRDEGLILVKPEAINGTHPFLERTPKSYVFQQFARFIRPHWVRLDLPDISGADAPLVAAFRKEDSSQLAVVLINPNKAASKAVTLRISGEHHYRKNEAFVTDRQHHCDAFDWKDSLSPESVTTVLFVAE